MPKTDEKVRGKHVSYAKKLRDDVAAELGSYEEGGPPVFVAFYDEGPGLSKRIENMDDDELDQVLGIELHMKRHTRLPDGALLETKLPD